MKAMILCGLPASGKTTIGKRLASFLCLPFIDTDCCITESYFSLQGERLTCKEIYNKQGASFFRKLEEEQIAAIQRKNQIIALGGGSLESLSNQKKIESLGRLVYLRIPKKSILARLSKRGRPAPFELSSDKEIESLFLKRTALFEDLCHFKVDVVEKPTGEIVHTLIEEFQKWHLTQ